MIEFFAIAFRYFAIFYMAYFLWQGVYYVLIERGRVIKAPKIPITKQKLTILFFHIKAILILAYNHRIGNDLALTTLGVGLVWVAFFLIGSLLVKQVYPKGCPLIWNGYFFLTSISMVVLLRLDPSLAQRQLLLMLAGFAVMLTLPLVIKGLPALERLKYVYALGGLALLLAIFYFGSEAFGSLRWLQIGPVGFSPAEVVAFSYVLFLAAVFRKKRHLAQLILPSALAVAHVVILVVQRNLGAALIFFMCYMILMYIGTGSLKLTGLGFGLFAIGSWFAYGQFAHVQVRVSVWWDPWLDVHGMGYQIIQSFFAMGAGGLFGRGLHMGIPGVIPVVARDMTFAAIAEEFGLIFSAGLIFVFVMIFYRGVHVALRCQRKFYALVAVGFTGVIAFQTFLIIGGTLNLVPLTGVTVPLISYGGTSLVVTTLMLGVLQWIATYENEEIDAISTEE